jgi:hypothetical protein
VDRHERERDRQAAICGARLLDTRMTDTKIAVKIVSMTSALMSVMPAPGLVMPSATACWLTVSRTTTAAAMAPMTLGHDVEDAVERRQTSIEDDPDRHRRIEVSARDVTEREDRASSPNPNENGTTRSPRSTVTAIWKATTDM